MDDDGSREIVAELEAQREAIAKLETSIAQGHVAILRDLRSLQTAIAIVVLAVLAIAVGVWWPSA